MVFCDQCGAKNFDGSNFCVSCGNPIKDQALSGNDFDTVEEKRGEHQETKYFLGKERTLQQVKNIKIGIGVIIGVILVGWLVYNSGVSEDQVYEDAIYLLQDEYESDIPYEVDSYTRQDLAKIEELKDNAYKVEGDISYVDMDLHLHFKVKMNYKGSELDSYEWEVGP